MQYQNTKTVLLVAANRLSTGRGPICRTLQTQNSTQLTQSPPLRAAFAFVTKYHKILFSKRCAPPPLTLPHPIPIGAFMRIHIRFSIEVSKCFTQFTPSSSPHPTPFLLGARFVFPLVENHCAPRFIAMLQHFTQKHMHKHPVGKHGKFHSFPTFHYICNDIISPPRRAATTPPP